MAKLGKKDREVITSALYDKLNQINNNLWVNAEARYLSAKDWDQEMRNIAYIVKAGIKVNPKFDPFEVEEAIDLFVKYHPLKKRGADYAATRWFSFLKKKVSSGVG